MPHKRLVRCWICRDRDLSLQANRREKSPQLSELEGRADRRGSNLKSIGSEPHHFTAGLRHTDHFFNTMTSRNKKTRYYSIQTLELHPFLVVCIEIDTLFLPPPPSIISRDVRFFQGLFNITHPILDRQTRLVPPF